MSQQSTPGVRPQLSRALDQMVGALEILDGLEAPGDIGPHLDLAIARLKAQLDLELLENARVEALLANLSAESCAPAAELANGASPWEAAPA